MSDSGVQWRLIKESGTHFVDITDLTSQDIEIEIPAGRYTMFGDLFITGGDNVRATAGSDLNIRITAPVPLPPAVLSGGLMCAAVAIGMMTRRRLFQ